MKALKERVPPAAPKDGEVEGVELGLLAVLMQCGEIGDALIETRRR